MKHPAEMTSEERLDLVVRQSMRAWRPPPRLKLSEWAERHYRLSEESAAQHGRFTPIPYQRGIMDAVTDPSVTSVTVMKSARVGYTKILNAAVGYYMHQDPCPIMVVQPTIEDAEGYSKEEIAPMLRDCPDLGALLLEGPKSKDSNNTILHKKFRGGILSMVGANSARGMRRVSRKVVALDEIDGYPLSAGPEGDPIRLAIRRSEYYWDRKILRGSTPTLAGISRIEAAFLEGDQRRYYVPCPHCGHMDILVFRRAGGGEEGSDRGHWMEWPEGKPEEAHFVCRRCGCSIEHRYKRDMVAAGEWRSEAPFRGHASFHIWAAYSYSPNATWAQLAEEFLQAKRDGPEALKTFVNTALGETWTERGEAPEWKRLYEGREAYPIGTVPDGPILLTAGVDVQKDRLVYEVVGWGEDKQSWCIDAGVIQGDTSGEAVWQDLDEQLLDRTWQRADGSALGIRVLAVDSGYNTNQVYSWARRHPMNRVIATKGVSRADALITAPSKVDVTVNGKRLARGYRVWPVGVDVAKSEFYGWLRLERPTAESKLPVPAGFCHFPQLGEEYFKQITAEQLVTVMKRQGFAHHEWQLIPGRENHWLDCRVLARAAAAFAGLERYAAAARIRRGAEARTPAQPQPHLMKYVEYIRNTGRSPLPATLFDSDWEPVGPRLRADLVAAGLVRETTDGLVLVHPAAPRAPAAPAAPAPGEAKPARRPESPRSGPGRGGGGGWLGSGRGNWLGKKR